MKIKINNVFVKFFNAGKINLKLDSIASTFAFSAKFNPENDTHKELFKPLKYLKCEIFNSENKLILTGTILNHSFNSNKDVNLISISGYSLSGILEDVRIPPKLYPLESINRNLKDIASRLCSSYDIGLIIDDTVSKEALRIYQKTTASQGDTVKGYLSKLTSQRNILLSHDEKGNVLMFKPNSQMKPVLYLNKENTLSMSSSFNGQGMHSDISIVRQPSKDNDGVSTVDTVNNPLIGIYRPTTKILSSGEDTDTRNAANNELASELKNISLKANLRGLRDTLKCGDIVNVHNHEIYSFAYSTFMIDSIDFSFDEKGESTELGLVLPETYTGLIPKNILFYYESHKREI